MFSHKGGLAVNVSNFKAFYYPNQKILSFDNILHTKRLFNLQMFTFHNDNYQYLTSYYK